MAQLLPDPKHKKTAEEINLEIDTLISEQLITELQRLKACKLEVFQVQILYTEAVQRYESSGYAESWYLLCQVWWAELQDTLARYEARLALLKFKAEKYRQLEALKEV